MPPAPGGTGCPGRRYAPPPCPLPRAAEAEVHDARPDHYHFRRGAGGSRDLFADHAWDMAIEPFTGRRQEDQRGAGGRSGGSNRQSEGVELALERCHSREHEEEVQGEDGQRWLLRRPPLVVEPG